MKHSRHSREAMRSNAYNAAKHRAAVLAAVADGSASRYAHIYSDHNCTCSACVAKFVPTWGPPPIGAHALAYAFAVQLEHCLDEEQMAAAIARDAFEPNSGICHTHNYCDANQAMLDALTSYGLVLDTRSDEQTQLINDAWNLARRLQFDSKVIKAAAKEAGEYIPLMTLDAFRASRFDVPSLLEAIQDCLYAGKDDRSGSVYAGDLYIENTPDGQLYLILQRDAWMLPESQRARLELELYCFAVSEQLL